MVRMLSLIALVALLALSAACGAAPPGPTQVAVPGTAATWTAAAEAVSPTVTHTPAEIEERPVTFATADGVTLSGTLAGSGEKAIVFSHMSDGSRREWGDLPRKLAAEGYLTLAYDFRGRGESQGTFDPPAAPIDVRAAMEFARRQGAQEIALVGASMGAMGSAKAAAGADIAALVFLAGTTSWRGLAVGDEEMRALGAPKLFITSEGDPFVAGTTHLFEAAAEPKEKHIYPGRLHGTQLFQDYAEDLEQRIAAFIRANL